MFYWIEPFEQSEISESIPPSNCSVYINYNVFRSILSKTALSFSVFCNSNACDKETYIERSEPKSKLTCSVCFKEFKSLPALNGHMRSHGGIRASPIFRQVSMLVYFFLNIWLSPFLKFAARLTMSFFLKKKYSGACYCSPKNVFFQLCFHVY